MKPLTDWLNQTILPGDTAVYVSSGRYTQRSVVKVVETRKRVRVRQIHPLLKDEFWLDASSLAVVGAFKTFKETP